MTNLMSVPSVDYSIGHTSDGLFTVRVSDAAFHADTTGPLDADAWFKAWVGGNAGVEVWQQDGSDLRVVQIKPPFEWQGRWMIELLVDGSEDEWVPLSKTPRSFPTQRAACKHLARLRRRGEV